MTPSDPVMPAGPLTGLRVLDLSESYGLYCGKLLADLGADVIKVEPPAGSNARHMPPFYHNDASSERSLHWFHFNTNKRSITLNLETADGRDLFHRLAATAAVVIEDATPGTMAALGVGYDALSAANPRLVYAAVTAFGQQGPHAGYKGSDLIGQAMGGLMFRIGWPEDPPNSLGGLQGLNQVGSHAAVGVMLALTHCDATGEGQFVDVSMQEAIAIINYDAMSRFALRRQVIHRSGPGVGSSGIVATRLWHCKQGTVRFQLVGTSVPEWPRLVEWLAGHSMQEDLADEKWRDAATRMAQLPHIEAVIDRFFMTKTAHELMDEGQARRIMITAFNTVADLFTEPQLTDEGFFTSVEHIALGETVVYPGGPYRFSATPWHIRRPAPALGEYNEAVYVHELGLRPDDLPRLKAAGAI